MKIDWYTKTILTIIAACLVWMCVRSAGETVLAQAQAAATAAGAGGAVGSAAGAAGRGRRVGTVESVGSGRN